MARGTKSPVDIVFLKKTELPADKAIHIAAVMAGVSERAVRRQVRKAFERFNQTSTLRRYIATEEVEAA